MTSFQLSDHIITSGWDFLSRSFANTWFTADNHFGHKAVIEYCNRPFSSVEEMDETMIQRWNMLVGPDDLVYHLGDMSLNPKFAIAAAQRLNGTIALIPGNHDACHPVHKRAKAYTRKYQDQCADRSNPLSIWYKLLVMNHSHRVVINDTEFWLNHLPVDVPPDTPEHRLYTEWRPPSDWDSWYICGHVHGAWKVKDRHINVGVDVWNYAPVHSDTVLDIIRERTP